MLPRQQQNLSLSRHSFRATCARKRAKYEPWLILKQQQTSSAGATNSDSRLQLAVSSQRNNKVCQSLTVAFIYSWPEVNWKNHNYRLEGAKSLKLRRRQILMRFASLIKLQPPIWARAVARKLKSLSGLATHPESQLTYCVLIWHCSCCAYLQPSEFQLLNNCSFLPNN